MRTPRIAYEGAVYHVTDRGAGQCVTFRNGAHYRDFIRLLNKTVYKYNIELLSYCLMGNHFHLLVRTPDANISQAMAYLKSLYTRKFNASVRRDGALFRGRFFSKLVVSDAQILQTSRYIHLNPVTAGICKQPTQYAWSSYNYFVGIIPPPPHLLVSPILDYFKEPKELGYKNFVETDKLEEGAY